MRARGTTILLVVIGAAIFVWMRLPWMEHLLMWDEAMNICTVRAFAAQAQDDYAYWFWRYPPAFNCILSLLSPLQDGFPMRAITCVVGIALLGWGMLLAFNREIYGFWMAWWSAFMLSVLPGAIFFGVWIKQDVLVIPLGIAALWLFARERYTWSGLVLGLCMLAKELGAFYALGIFALWCMTPGAVRHVKNLMVTASIAAATCGWWYVLFSASRGQYFYFITGRESSMVSAKWEAPWHYYFGSLNHDLGLLGVLLALVGLFSLVKYCRAREASGMFRFWPIAVAVPTVLILSMSSGKTPWYMYTVLPAFATLEALGLMWIWHRLREVGSGRLRQPFPRACLFIAAVVILALPQWGRDYEQEMARRQYGLWSAANKSRAAAQALNQVAQDGERALLTSMHYYGEAVAHMVCPIFVVYMERDLPVVVRPYTISTSEVIALVQQHRLDWAMLSPYPGPQANDMITRLVREHGLPRPLLTDGAVVFKTSALYD